MSTTNGTLDAIPELVGPLAVLLPIPKGQKGPRLAGWQKLTRESSQTPEHQALLAAAGNIGILLGSVSGDLVDIDLDSDEAVERFTSLNLELVSHTLQTLGSRGRHFFFRIKGPYPQKIVRLEQPGEEHIGEWRGGGGAQTVIAGTHPSGVLYQIVNAVPVDEIEFGAIQWPPEWVTPTIEETWESDLAAGQCTSLALAALILEPRKPVIGGWCFVGDLGFIYAGRGIGKTWLAMDIAHALAEAKAVGPWKVFEIFRVLYLDGEMPPQDIKARDFALGNPTENLAYINHELLFLRTGRIMNLADPEFQNGVIALCIAQNRTVLFLDNLSSLASGINENDGIDWEKIQPWLLQLRRLHITVIFIHHAGRNNQMRGHSKREDPAFWVLRLDAPTDAEEKPGARFISRFTKWRNATKKPATYEWNYMPVADGEICVEFKEASPLQVFRDLIDSGVNTNSALATEMDVTPGYISQLATKAKDAGWLHQQGRGRYEIK